MGTWRTIGMACLLVTAMWWLQPATPHIEPAAAVAHEGKTVHLQGVVTDTRSWSDGGRFVLARDGHGIDVQVAGTLPGSGSWVEVTGDLRRVDGDLRLWADAWHTLAPPSIDIIPLAVIAADPQGWSQRYLQVQGRVDGDTLTDGQRTVPLVDGPRLHGDVIAGGALQYDDRCLCHRMHVTSMRPWTS